MKRAPAQTLAMVNSTEVKRIVPIMTLIHRGANPSLMMKTSSRALCVVRVEVAEHILNVLTLTMGQ